VQASGNCSLDSIKQSEHNSVTMVGVALCARFQIVAPPALGNWEVRGTLPPLPSQASVRVPRVLGNFCWRQSASAIRALPARPCSQYQNLSSVSGATLTRDALLKVKRRDRNGSRGGRFVAAAGSGDAQSAPQRSDAIEENAVNSESPLRDSASGGGQLDKDLGSDPGSSARAGQDRLADEVASTSAKGFGVSSSRGADVAESRNGAVEDGGSGVRKESVLERAMERARAAKKSSGEEGPRLGASGSENVNQARGEGSRVGTSNPETENVNQVRGGQGEENLVMDAVWEEVRDEDVDAAIDEIGAEFGIDMMKDVPEVEWVQPEELTVQEAIASLPVGLMDRVREVKDYYEQKDRAQAIKRGEEVPPLVGKMSVEEFRSAEKEGAGERWGGWDEEGWEVGEEEQAGETVQAAKPKTVKSTNQEEDEDEEEKRKRAEDRSAAAKIERETSDAAGPLEASTKAPETAETPRSDVGQEIRTVPIDDFGEPVWNYQPPEEEKAPREETYQMKADDLPPDLLEHLKKARDRQTERDVEVLFLFRMFWHMQFVGEKSLTSMPRGLNQPRLELKGPVSPSTLECLTSLGC
jgi:hypothetical protein